MFLNSDTSNTIKNDKSMHSPIRRGETQDTNIASIAYKKRRKKICIVCKKISVPGDSRTFHSFPKNEDLRKKWVTAIGVSKVKKSTLICSDHFGALSYYQIVGDSTWRRLLPEAVPQNTVYADGISSSRDKIFNLSTKNKQESGENADCQEKIKMEDEPVLVSGEVETIIIQPDSLELLFDNEESSFYTEQDLKNSEVKILEENCSLTFSNEVNNIYYDDIVQTPFCLENYFMDSDYFRKRSLFTPVQPQVVKIDRVTCYECEIVFCTEHKLLEHLMTHIDVNKMGCNVCDKDLNLPEKFQLHIMAVTWQSIYYCDFCRKSCAGVVRCKSQQPPPGKTYMCHDCENQTKQLTVNFQHAIRFHENLMPETIQKSIPSLLVSPDNIPSTTSISLQPLLFSSSSISVSNSLPIPEFSSVSFTSPILPSIQFDSSIQSSSPLPSDVLQNHKQTKISEVSNETHKVNSLEIQDCFKTLPKRKENEKMKKQKSEVQVIKDLKQTIKVSMRPCLKKKPKQNCKCRYCPVTFSENFLLMRHLREKHKFHKLRYICNLCSKEFIQKRSYEDHINFHQSIKNHVCSMCDLDFLSKYELVQHEKIHFNDKVLKRYCDKPNDNALDLRKKRKKKKEPN